MTGPADWLPLLAAPFAGSFLGVLVRRLPAGRPVARGRSACESCGVPLSPRDLIPLLSALWLRGRCRRCHARFSPMHWWIELAAVIPAACAVFAGGGPAVVWAGCILGWALLALAWIDLQHFLLPDVLTLPLLLAGLGATVLLSPADAPAHAAAAALGYLALHGIALAYRAWRGREGLGMGDAKLLGAAGAWVGLSGLSPVLLGGVVASLVLALVLRARGTALTATTRIPFGPGLCAATWMVWLWG